MELVLVAAKAVAKIFIYVLVGFVACKAGVFDKNVSDGASKILINICCPALAMASFFREYNPELLKGIGISVILELCYYAIAIGIGLVFSKKDNPNKEIERASVMYHNCGFIGIPIAQMILGPEGVIYQAIRLALFHFVFFTHATLLFAGKVDKKSLVKTLLSPAVVCAVLGVVVYLTQFQLPSIIEESIVGIGNAATPLGMMIAGGIIARTDMLAILKRKRVYLICLIKLIIMPLIMALICKALGLPDTLSIAAVIAAACPQANFINIYSEMYGKDSGYSLGIFGFGTLVSMATIPLMVIIYGLL